MHFETSTYFNSDLKISLQKWITSEDKISEEHKVRRVAKCMWYHHWFVDVLF